MKDNLVVLKTFQFAVKIIETFKILNEDKKEYILSKQLLRAGTSIGANVREGVQAQSKKDFISKMSIALKEAYETEYWIELLIETKFLVSFDSDKLLKEVREIIKILSSIILTSKSNLAK
jgi:four helix bundle protein